MGYGYQKRDYEFVDYQLWEMDEVKQPFRGPKPALLEKNQYFACLGAAQTFGCFCQEPFPILLSKKIGINVLNIGHAGAGPLLFLRNHRYIRLTNNAKFAIVQVMSGRSESNALFTSEKGRGQLIRMTDGITAPAEKMYDDLIAVASPEEIEILVAETRRNYTQHFIELLQQIHVPKILFWFSERTPDYTESYEDARKLFGKYPHLVNRKMMEKIKPFADH